MTLSAGLFSGFSQPPRFLWVRVFFSWARVFFSWVRVFCRCVRVFLHPQAGFLKNLLIDFNSAILYYKNIKKRYKDMLLH
jgi:hypothetical protein